MNKITINEVIKRQLELSKNVEQLISQDYVLDEKIERNFDNLHSQIEGLQKRLLEDIKKSESKTAKRINEYFGYDEGQGMGDTKTGKKFKGTRTGFGINSAEFDVLQKSVKELEEKVGILTNKILDVENNLKSFKSKSDIENLRNTVIRMSKELKDKLTKEDLTELYDYHLDIKDQIYELKDAINILKDYNANTDKKFLEINRHLETFNIAIKGLQGKKVDFLNSSNKGVDEAKKVAKKQDFQRFEKKEMLNVSNEEAEIRK